MSINKTKIKDSSHDWEKLEYDVIVVDKILKNVFIAKTTVIKPRKIFVEMHGKTEQIAKQKLELFLQNKPYKHLD